MTGDNNISVKSVSIKWGLILGLISIILFVLFRLANLESDSKINYISFIPTVAAIVLAHKAFKEGGDGYMSYGQGLGIGTLTCLISGVLSSVFTYVYLSFIDSSLIEMAREKAYEGFEEQGMSDAAIEQASKWTDMFTNPTAFMIIGIISSIIIGFILSLVIAAITKNNNPELEI